MRDNLIQNIDIPQDNPATPEVAGTKEKAPKVKNPKIIILIVLGSIVALLLIAALIVSATKDIKPPTKRGNTITPTPTPNAEIITTPTPITSQIPQEFQTQFNEIEKENTNLRNLPPPQIDVQIGIEAQ